MIAERVEALVIARAFAPAAKPDLVTPLERYAPPTLTVAAWREQLAGVIAALRGRGVLDGKLALADRKQLAVAIGKHGAVRWDQLAGRVLPALGLGLAADDKAKLDGATWWSAVAARALGVWTAGPPPALSALRDRYVWRELGVPGAPRRCPDAIAALFLQRALGSDAATFERQVKRCAAAAVGAPRQDLALVKAGLVRLWCEGKRLGPAGAVALSDGASSDGPVPASSRGPAGPVPFVDEVRTIAGHVRDGAFGDRKVFIAAVWNELRRSSGSGAWAMLSLADFKTRLVAAHRAGELELARADLVAAMDPELVAASETTTDGASFHFIVRAAS